MKRIKKDFSKRRPVKRRPTAVVKAHSNNGYTFSLDELDRFEQLQRRLVNHIAECSEELPPDAPRFEAAFQSEVIACAKASGWLYYHTHNSKLSPAGFPDLYLVDRYGFDGDVIAELKSERGVLEDKQELWIDALRASPTNHRVFVWRPRDWLEVRQVLHRQVLPDLRSL